MPLIVTLLMFLSQAWATKVDLKLSPALECALLVESERHETLQTLLKQSLPAVVKGDPIQGHVGLLSELKELMTAANMEPSKIRFSMELLKSILYANKGKETVLGNLAERFTEFDHDEKSLLICIVSGTCDLRYGVALHMTVMSEFDIVPFTTLPGENTRFGWIRGVMDTPPNDIPRIIILSGGDRDRLEWTLEFLHESIHFADFALINDWLSANDKLARHGHGPDDLFRQYVRPGPDNRLQVDEGFLRIFLESRAYGGEIAYFESFLEPRLRKSMTEKQKRRVMDDIRGFQTVTQPIAKKLNLTSDSVFKVGERLGRKMMATIKRAKEL